jgi:hypothetical protein
MWGSKKGDLAGGGWPCPTLRRALLWSHWDGAVLLLVACGFGITACGGAQSQSLSRVVRLGCGTYCQQAGIAQGLNPSQGKIPVKIITRGAVGALADGSVPITVTCNAAFSCRGALVLALTNPAILGLHGPIPAAEARLSEGQVGESDLAVGARSTRILGVTLVPQARKLLRSHASVSIDVLAETGRDYAVSSRSAIEVARR